MTSHDVGALIERAFWYVLVGAVGLGVSVLRDISKSIAELNND